MKKKIISLCLVIALVAVAVVGGTLAYFTDTDDAINVMTSGRADIVQNEQQRVVTKTPKYDKYNADGTPAEGAQIVGYDVSYADAVDGKVQLEDFADYKLLVPAVYYNEDGTVMTPTDAGTASWGKVSYIGGNEAVEELNASSLMNEVDKIVTVTNTGSVPVYVRTIFLFEDKFIDECVLDNCTSAEHKHYLTEQVPQWWNDDGLGQKNSGMWNWVTDANGDCVMIELNGTKYTVTVHYYETELLPGQTSEPSLKQFALDPRATNESFYDHLIDGNYTILALSQAVQTDGFNDDRAALNAAFGNVDADNVEKIAEWFQDVLDDADTETTFPEGHYANGEDNNAADGALN